MVVILITSIGTILLASPLSLISISWNASRREPRLVSLFRGKSYVWPQEAIQPYTIRIRATKRGLPNFPWIEWCFESTNHLASHPPGKFPSRSLCLLLEGQSSPKRENPAVFCSSPLITRAGRVGEAWPEIWPRRKKKEQRGSTLADISAPALWQQTMDQINGKEISEIYIYLILRRSGKIPKWIELQRWES